MENIKLKYDDNGMGVWTAKAGGGNVTIDEHCHVTVIDPSNPAHMVVRQSKKRFSLKKALEDVDIEVTNPERETRTTFNIDLPDGTVAMVTRYFLVAYETPSAIYRSQNAFANLDEAQTEALRLVKQYK